PKVTVKVGLGSPERGCLHIGALHQHAVPDELKQKDEHESGKKRDKTSFVIHVAVVTGVLFGCRCKRRSDLTVPTDRHRLFLQARKVTVTDKGRMQFSVSIYPALNLEIEYADAVARFALIR